MFQIKLCIARPVARINFGEVLDLSKVDLLDPKCGRFEPHPITLPQPPLPHFLPTLARILKSGLNIVHPHSRNKSHK